MGCPSLPSLVAMWLSISTASAAFFLPTTTVLLPSRSVRHRARACVLAQADAPTEVPPQSVFATLDYDAEFVPWDIGEAQPQVRNAARDGAFGSAGTTVLDCGCGAGDNANWLAARGHTMSKARPILPASAAQPADRPRLAEALGNLRHALPLKQASREPAQLAEGGASLFSTCRTMVGGHDVLGFDLSPSAVATAREVSGYADVLAAMAEHGGAVEFTQASAVDLGGAERVQANILTLTTTLTLSLALTTLRGQRPQSRPRPNSNSDPSPHPNPDHAAQARAKELGGFAGRSYIASPRCPCAAIQLYAAINHYTLLHTAKNYTPMQR